MDLHHDKIQSWRVILPKLYAVANDEESDIILRRYREAHGRILPEPAEQPGGFEIMGSFVLPHSSRLLRASCCPDKDLMALVSKVGSKDHLSLWELQGSKKWQIELHKGLPTPEEVTALAWSPDGIVPFYYHSILHFTAASLYGRKTPPG